MVSCLSEKSDDVDDQGDHQEHEDGAAEDRVMPAFRMGRAPETTHADHDGHHGDKTDRDTERAADRGGHTQCRSNKREENVGEEAPHRGDENRLLER